MHVPVSRLFLIFAAAACLSLLGVEAQASDAQQIVAEINDVKITKERLDRELDRQLKKELVYFDRSERHRLRSELIERMIERELLLQAARKRQLFPSPKEVNDLLASVKNEMSANASLSEELSSEHMNEEEFVNGLKEDLAIKRYLEQTVFARAAVEEKEIADEYSRSGAQYAEPEQVSVRHILIKLPPDADEKTAEDVRRRAEEVLRQARQPRADFGQLAELYSEAPNASKGGALGFLSQNQLEREFADAAFALAPGEISGLVRTKFGFHIIRLEERKGQGLPPLADVHDQILLVLKKKKMDRLLADELVELRARNRVVVYHR